MSRDGSVGSSRCCIVTNSLGDGAAGLAQAFAFFSACGTKVPYTDNVYSNFRHRAREKGPNRGLQRVFYARKRHSNKAWDFEFSALFGMFHGSNLPEKV